MNKKHKVLDKGFITLIDHMGSDEFICEAARVSYAANNKVRKKNGDKNLINYLIHHNHTSPFEMAELVFHVKLPIFVARQWIRHRTASVSEVSGRYTILNDFHTPKVLRGQSEDNKQGSSDREIKDVFNFDVHHSDLHGDYMHLIDQGVAKEQARIILPLSTYTEWYWKIDLHNLLHFLQLRLHEHAQKEIREYAKIISKIVEKLFPLTHKAFVNYRLKAITLSQKEQAIILSSSKEGRITALVGMNALSDREKKELKDKLFMMGLT